MASCILFHGPGAQQAVLQEAHRLGRLIGTYGEDGLKVDDAREFVGLMHSAPIGGARGVLVAGPMDEAMQRSSDVLLKSIEEFNPQVVFPLLWANDLGGVTGTIRSRCLDRWCPDAPLEENPEAVEAAEKIAHTLLACALGNQPWLIPKLVASLKDNLPRVLGLLAEALLPKLGDPVVRKLWERLRRVTIWRNPTVPELVAALFPQEGDR